MESNSECLICNCGDRSAYVDIFVLVTFLNLDRLTFQMFYDVGVSIVTQLNVESAVNKILKS